MLYMLKFYLSRLGVMPVVSAITQRLPWSYWKLFRPRFLCFAKLIKQGDLVFDVGANIGQSLENFLPLGARVIAVEPQPNCVRVLKEKFDNNKNVTIIQGGLSDKENVLTLFFCEDASMSSFATKWKKGRFSNCNWQGEVEVAVTTIDSLIKQFGIPKFCKIDVEGFELQVLKGLTFKIPFISFEFTREVLDDAKLCVDHILSLGTAKFNFSLYAQHTFYSLKWLDPQSLFNVLESIPNEDLCGDIYAAIE
jgi:FkbM family methyltransferase